MFKKRKVGIPGADWLIPLVIFTCAFGIRATFVSQVSESPYWRVPLVDAKVYDDAAQEMNGKSWLSPLAEGHYSPYFQPPLYQTFLALVYRIFGHSVLNAIIIQYLIGSLVCVLTYFIGQRFFARGVGIAAGVATAFTATQIYYEGRLLPPVLITFFNLTIILLAVKQLSSPAVWRLPVIGLLIGLSAITRPDILLFVPPLLVWMWLERRAVLARQPVLWTGILLFGIVLPVGLVSLRNQVVGKDFALISWNGGVNFFLGNHPNMELMVGIRPGMNWEAFMHQPLLATSSARPSEWNKYFFRAAFGLMRKCKKATLLNLARKFLWVWRGPEIRRNEDEYYLTRASPLYRLLLWRVGNFGFPFGVIAPLALLGMVLNFRRRRELFLLYAYVFTQVMVLVAFFPCSRYRAPMVPVLLMFGAAAAFEMLDLARRKRAGELLSLSCMLLAFGVAATLYPPKFEGTEAQREAENCRLLGTAYYAENRLDEGIAASKRGLELVPDDPDMHKWLMDVYYEKGEYARAEKHALECIRLVPQYGPVYMTLIQIYKAQGRDDKAAEIKDIVEAYGEGPITIACPM